MMIRSALALCLLAAACGGGSQPAPEPADQATTAETGVPAETPATETASPSVVETRSFESEALGVEKSYVVYLPAGYESSPARRWPVLYMLHGLGGNETNWRNLGIKDVADELGFEGIIVMPDGDDGFYVNWVTEVDYDACLESRRAFGKATDMKTYCVKEARYEDYIAQDLIGHVDSTYRTVADRKARAIGGLSMGGYGSLYLAMRRPLLFGAAASHAGVATLLYAGPEPYEKGKVQLVSDPEPWLKEAGKFGQLFRRIWGTDIETWRAHDPTLLAQQLAPDQLELYVDCGTEDEFKLQNHNQYLHEVLDKRGLDHEFHLVEGGHHDDAFWKARVDDSLGFVKQFFQSGTGSTQPTR